MGKTLARGELRHGLRAIDLRNVLRRVARGAYTVEELRTLFKLPPERADAVIKGLVLDGWLCKAVEGGQAWYALTDEGYAFCHARGLKPVPREKIAALLDKVLQTCADINADGRSPCFVRTLYVFGSYLGDAEMLGDLDLAVDIGDRPVALSNERRMEWLVAYGAGHGQRCWEAQFLYAPDGVKKLIKGGSPYVSIHTAKELKDLGAPAKVVFRAGVVAPALVGS